MRDNSYINGVHYASSYPIGFLYLAPDLHCSAIQMRLFWCPHLSNYRRVAVSSDLIYAPNYPTIACVDTIIELGTILNQVRNLNGWSCQNVADRATVRGYKLSKSNVSRLATESPLLSISATAIRGLSVALGVSEHRIAMAALSSMGIATNYEPPTAREAIIAAHDIPDAVKSMLLAMLNSLESG